MDMEESSIKVTKSLIDSNPHQSIKYSNGNNVHTQNLFGSHSPEVLMGIRNINPYLHYNQQVRRY